MNSLEAIEKLRIRHEQEAQQCIEIFRSFCQWYQSQYNFEQIESTFWNACIYLIEKRKCRIDVSALSKGGFSMHTNPVIMIARC